MFSSKKIYNLFIHYYQGDQIKAVGCKWNAACMGELRSVYQSFSQETSEEEFYM